MSPAGGIHELTARNAQLVCGLIPVQYGIKEDDGLIDYNQMEDLAQT